MKVCHYLLILLCLITGCRNDHAPKLSGHPLLITGNNCPDFSSAARSQTGTDFLQEGDRITFFCEGGITANGVILTYNGTNWIPETPLQWSGDEKASFTAVYPVMPLNENGNYDATGLYNEDGTLKDVLFCQGESEYGQEIRLDFSHRFSQLNIQANAFLNKRIDNVVCQNVPIQSFNPKNNEIILQESEFHQTGITKNEEGVYSFIFPPSGDQKQDITLTFNMTDMTCHTNKISGTTFEPGSAYICKANSSGNLPGIYNAEDFIAFSHLINGEEYEGRNLDEFGETVNGVTTYYLRNDIEFTEEESERLTYIGGTSIAGEKSFDDIFDGLGHTLSSIVLKKIVTGLSNYGIWGEIGETGVIRNLTLDSIAYQQNGKFYYLGLLAGLNKGTIYNCTLKNSSIQMTDEKTTSNNFGGFISRNEGTVYNCQIKSVKIQAKDKYSATAGIIKYNHGKILNCSATNIEMKTMQSGAHISYINYGRIQNCYVYKSSGKNYNGICRQTEKDSYINDCYYPSNFETEAVEKTNKSLLVIVTEYNNKSHTIITTGEPLYERLNQWINGTGAEEYPDLEFLRWEKGENLPAILIMP